MLEKDTEKNAIGGKRVKEGRGISKRLRKGVARRRKQEIGVSGIDKRGKIRLVIHTDRKQAVKGI